MGHFTYPIVSQDQVTVNSAVPEILLLAKTGPLAIEQDDLVSIHSDDGKVYSVKDMELASMRLTDSLQYEYPTANPTTDRWTRQGYLNATVFYDSDTDLITVIAGTLHDNIRDDLSNLKKAELVEIRQFDRELNLLRSIPLVSEVYHCFPTIKKLSNDNLLVQWDDDSHFWFQIFSPTLTPITPPYDLGIFKSQSTQTLTNGGFVITVVDVLKHIYVQVFDNDGLLGAAPVAAVNSNAALVNVDQLSTNEIVIFYTTIIGQSYFSIIPESGNVSSFISTQISNLGTGPVLGMGADETRYYNQLLSTMNGYFCCVREEIIVDTNTGLHGAVQLSFAVLNNVGQQRNYGTDVFTVPGPWALAQDTLVEGFDPATYIHGSFVRSFLAHDNTRFVLSAVQLDANWIPGTLHINMIPTTGSNLDNRFINTKLDNHSNASSYAASYVNITSGFLYNKTVVFSAGRDIIKIRYDGNVVEKCEAISDRSQVNTGIFMMPEGSLVILGSKLDSAADAVGSDNIFNPTVGIIKYFETTIIGVAAQQVLAGNENTVLPIKATLGSHPANQVKGSPMRFDFSNPTAGEKFLGSRGMLYSDSVLFY